MIVAAATGTAIAMGVAGIVAVLAISAAFYAIGRGEDRERAAAAPAEEPAGDAAEDRERAATVRAEEPAGDAAEDRAAGPADPHAARPRLSARGRRRRRP